MSFTSDSEVPPQPSSQTRVTRAIRPRILIAVAVVLVVIVSLGTVFAVIIGHNTPSFVGNRPTAAAAAAATATLAPSDLVTEGDAQALFGGFLPACEDAATYALAGQGVPCPKLDRGRIYEVGGHYCADDWHVVSSQLIDSQANLEQYKPQQTIDGVTLQTTRTAIRPIDPAYAQQQHYGDQAFYIQIGVVLSPQQISVGKHTLRQFDAAIGFDRPIPFTIDASGTGACQTHQ